MSLILKDKVTGPAAWRGSDLKNDHSWALQLSPISIDCIDKALAVVKKSGLSFPGFEKEDFPIHDLSSELSQYAEEMENGKGFLLLKGLPIERYTVDDLKIIYYGLGLHMGTPVCQNLKGDLLGNVMNVGDITKKETRV